MVLLVTFRPNNCGDSCKSRISILVIVLIFISLFLLLCFSFINNRNRGKISSNSSKSERSFVASKWTNRGSSIAVALGGSSNRNILRRKIIQNNQGYLKLPLFGRTYFYGENNYDKRNQNTTILCEYNISYVNDKYFDLWLNDENFTKITEILYECSSTREYCCDDLDCCFMEICSTIMCNDVSMKCCEASILDCCSAKRFPPWAIIIMLTTVIFIAIFGILYCIIKLRKRSHSLKSQMQTQMQVQHDFTMS